MLCKHLHINFSNISLCIDCTDWLNAQSLSLFKLMLQNVHQSRLKFFSLLKWIKLCRNWTFFVLCSLECTKCRLKICSIFSTIPLFFRHQPEQPKIVCLLFQRFHSFFLLSFLYFSSFFSANENENEESEKVEKIEILLNTFFRT
jgi:hypothetical protein